MPPAEAVTGAWGGEAGRVGRPWAEPQAGAVSAVSGLICPDPTPPQLPTSAAGSTAEAPPRSHRSSSSPTSVLQRSHTDSVKIHLTLTHPVQKPPGEAELPKPSRVVCAHPLGLTRHCPSSSLSPSLLPPTNFVTAAPSSVMFLPL